MSILGVRGVRHDLKEVFIAGYAAHIFRRASVSAIQAPWRVQRTFELGSLYQRNAMPPGIAVVVKIVEGVRTAQRFFQANPLRIFKIVLGLIGIGFTVVQVVDDEIGSASCRESECQYV